VLSVTYARRADLSAGTLFNAELRGGAVVRTAYVSADDASPNFQAILRGVTGNEVVVVGAYVNITSETATADAPRAFIEFVDSLQSRGAKVILVSFGSPYLLSQTPSIGSYAIAWGGSSSSQRAAARALLGEITITARLPISIPPLLAIGAGERRSVAPSGATVPSRP
jgi:beta-N-acetylhexosaminidase